MAQWEDKLGAILNNPQAMSQIMSIAQSLDGAQDGQSAPDAQVTPAEPVPQPAAEPADMGLELDPKLMEVGMRALAAYRDPNNDRAALLQALRPFVKESRYGKIDKAVQIARLSKVVRAALDGWKGDEG